MKQRLNTLLIVLFLFGQNQVNAQVSSVNLSGTLVDSLTKENLPFVNVVLRLSPDSTFIGGTITDESGRFTIENINPDNYFLAISYYGYKKLNKEIYVGESTEFIN
ncbi:MAG: carboxypeptidase-like regulatory domain-containing protein, partial [Crocinitomicaceae bacterium]|nr:carboxypeptidase-like regulatory domain-containing protein [Crocinitomicaceae bacterium]